MKRVVLASAALLIAATAASWLIAENSGPPAAAPIGPGEHFRAYEEDVLGRLSVCKLTLWEAADQLYDYAAQNYAGHLNTIDRSVTELLPLREKFALAILRRVARDVHQGTAHKLPEEVLDRLKRDFTSGRPRGLI